LRAGVALEVEHVSCVFAEPPLGMNKLVGFRVQLGAEAGVG
jgi:hypothetical protein